MRKTKLILANICFVAGLLLFIPLTTRTTKVETRIVLPEIEIQTQQVEKVTICTENYELYTLNLKEAIQSNNLAVRTLVELSVSSSNYISQLDVSMKHKFTDEEIEILYRITEAEATGCDIEAKKNVTSNIIARVLSDEFPDDVESVVFQKKQYSPISDKRYYKVAITEETIQAVNEVLQDGVTHDYTYFFNLDKVKSSSILRWVERDLEFGFTDSANHSFYKEKE